MNEQIPRKRLQEPLPDKQVPGMEAATSGSSADRSPPDGQHPAFGAMKGLLTASPDLDLTQPVDPEWGGS